MMAGYELPVTRVGLGGMDSLGVALGSGTDYLGLKLIIFKNFKIFVC